MQQPAVLLPMGPGPALESSRIGSLLPFDDAEIYRFIGVLFVSGIAPKPRIDYWFEPAQTSPLFWNDVVSRAMAKEVPFTGKRIQGMR